MKCWAVRKILSLHAGDDLTVGRKAIDKHLQNCRACAQQYNVHTAMQNKLHLLQNTSLQDDHFDNYWRELKTKLDEERVEEKSVPVNKITWLHPGFSVNGIMAAASLVLIIAVFSMTNFLPVINTSSESTSADLQLRLPPIQQTQPKDKFEASVFKPLEAEEVFMYKLDAVHPCVLRSTEF